MSFTDEEVERYARHLVLREIGGQGQQRLQAAKVLIVGAGGLGAPAALYLAAAGVGRLGLVDADSVALSNLQRQVLYGTADVGRGKVIAAGERLVAINPHVSIDPHPMMLDDANARELVRGYHLVLDGTDSFETRFLVNAACYAEGKPLVSGAIGRWTGQLALFEAGLTRGRPPGQRKPCYRCLVGEMPPDAETCSAVGVMGALAGVIGSMMALEAIKQITGAGETLSGRLLIYDALSAEIRTIGLPPDPGCEVCGGDQ
ncbi:MAG TPA: molybdopterin-synthase adenylyltransferase MoeB [Caulobacteraceae bacterium]